MYRAVAPLMMTMMNDLHSFWDFHRTYFLSSVCVLMYIYMFLKLYAHKCFLQDCTNTSTLTLLKILSCAIVSGAQTFFLRDMMFRDLYQLRNMNIGLRELVQYGYNVQIQFVSLLLSAPKFVSVRNSVPCSINM
jgi:hypothetical protein